MSNAYTPFTSISVKTSTDVTHARSVIIEFGHAIEPIPIPLIRNEATRGVEMTPSSSVSASRSKFMNTPLLLGRSTSPRKPDPTLPRKGDSP
ncbi:type i inositol--trisphosphate 5-phosphatase 11 [Moniliophthora roreri]|nr:type i inositol--trisphosphate 5-phosphatase 11 [Moniliophthora roreri]